MIDKIKAQYRIRDILIILGIPPQSFVKTPMKEEKTPSLKIYYDTDSFYDFSAGVGGDQIDLYSHLRRCSIAEAIQELSDRMAHASFSTDKLTRRKSAATKKNYESFLLNESEAELFYERAGIMEFDGYVNTKAAEKYAYRSVLTHRAQIQQLIFRSLYDFEIQDWDIAIYEYLRIKRKLAEHTIKHFRIFAIKGPQRTAEFLNDCFSEYELSVSGLMINRKFLFEKHRLVIPYMVNGKISYLRGRYFHRDDENMNQPKYKGLANISKTLSSKRFFNIDLLKSKTKEVLICEGEFDTMIANQIGRPAIGVPGVTNFPAQDVELLKGLDVYLLFDSDDPGRKAADLVIAKIKGVANRIVKWELTEYKDLTEYIYGNS